MAGSKKRKNDTIEEVHTALLDKIAKCKPLLDKHADADLPILTQDLLEIGTEAESFSQLRQSLSKQSWSGLVDSLDQEGVNLWNVSGIIQKSTDESHNAHVAALRYAAFRLVEAGLEAKPGLETLIHLLQLANKTAAGLIDTGNIPIADKVLTSAKEYEEAVCKEKAPDDALRRSMISARIMFYSIRMEAAWKEGKHTQASYFCQKIVDENHDLSDLPVHTRNMLISQFHTFGRSLLKGGSDGSRPSEAVEWLQRAFSLVDRTEEGSPDLSELKISILRTMGKFSFHNDMVSFLLSVARAHFLAQSYDRAESVLEELIPSLDSISNAANSEYHELRWLQLVILKKRKASDSALLNSFRSIIDHMEFSDAEVSNVLQELKSFGSQHGLVTSVHGHCLDQALQRQSTEPELIQRLILSLIFHCSKGEDHAKSMDTLGSAFTSLCDADIELPSVPTTACLSLLWQQGGRLYGAKKWAEAAAWFLAGSHKLFRSCGSSNITKCFRKAALCYIEQRDYAQASAVIRRCPMNEATSLYVVFIIAVRQGLEDEAIRAVQDMLKAADFDRRMLLLATSISHQSEMKPVLLSVLEGLLCTLKAESNGECISEAMTLVRCIVRLILGLLVQPTAHRQPLIDNVVKQFQKAKALTEEAVKQKATSLVLKDVQWLWRTAYNCAVQGCSEWEGAGEQISDLFDISRELLEACIRVSPMAIDADTCLHLANASFAAVSGRVFATREVMEASETIDESRISKVVEEIRHATARITDVVSKDVMRGIQDCQRIEYFLHALRVFETEFCVHLKAWEDVSHVVHEVAKSGPGAIGTFEAIADILWLEHSCPQNVLCQCLESILRASLDHRSCSVEKFSRWLRTICTISLSRNTDADRKKTIGYFEHALNVLEDHAGSNASEETYPTDERQWLLSTAFDTGRECLQSSNLDEAKRWFELATVACRFVTAGQDQAAKISEAYSTLLSHYQAHR